MDMDIDTNNNFLIFAIVIGCVMLGGMVIVPTLMDAASEAATSGSATPDLYELTKQTAENTRHIFWLLAVGFVCLFGLIGHYGRCLGKTRPHDN
jgi:hypothetical protein